MRKNTSKHRNAKTYMKSPSYGTYGSGFGKSFGSPSGTASRKTKTNKTGMVANVARGYSQIHNTFETRYQAYRMLWDQTRGACKGTRPTPATLKSFSNWINKGAHVWKVTNNQINKWCHTRQTFKTCATAKNVLCNRFGKTTIKAIMPSKSGGFLVATSPTCKGKPFKFPM